MPNGMGQLDTCHGSILASQCQEQNVFGSG